MPEIEPENKSTGPRSPAGKQRSSQNAITHGLFARSFLVEGESQEDFDKLHNGFIEEHMPEGTTEDSLVFNLAQTEWRRRRLMKMEATAMEKALQAGETECKFMTNYSIYAQRLNRDFQSVLKTLKEHQAPRWKANGLWYRVAVHMLDKCQRSNIPWEPSDDEFVFSKATLEKQLRFNQDWDDISKTIQYYPGTKEMDERWAKEDHKRRKAA